MRKTMPSVAMLLSIMVAGCGVRAPQAPGRPARAIWVPSEPVPSAPVAPPATVEAPAIPPAPPIDLTPTPAQQAARLKQADSLFASAGDLERMQKFTGAVETYARIFMRFNGTPIADRSAARIRALGAKVPGEEEVRAFQSGERERDLRDAEAARMRVENKARDAIAREDAREERARRQREEASAQAAAAAPSQVYAPSGTHVGPRGGVYHYSRNGNKVYHRKR